MNHNLAKGAVVAAAMLLGVGNDASARDINFNQGGHIAKFRQQYDQALVRNEQYRIKGSCMSACTIFLGLPKVCVYPNAQLGFHGAWPKSASAKKQRIADARMGNYLPPRLKKLYMEKWRHNGAMSFKMITGRQAAAIQPGLKLCT